MVGGVFSQQLGSTGDPASQDTQDDTADGQNHEDQKDRLGLVKVQKIAHPSDHSRKELTDLGEDGSDSGSGSSLKSSPFLKNLWTPVTDGAGEPT